MAELRIRSTELRQVRASDLLLDDRNWRDHPDLQAGALAGVLSEIGLVAPIIARETAEGLVIVDGHLRTQLAGDAVVPVLVVDLDEDEAALVMATYDPIADLAAPDLAKLSALVSEIQTSAMENVEAFLDVTETVLPPHFAAESEGAHYSDPVQPEYFSRGNAFVLPFSRQKEVRVWTLNLPADEFDAFIAEAQALSHRLGFGDDGAALVMHCLEAAYDALNADAAAVAG